VFCRSFETVAVARLSVGPTWASLTEVQRQELTESLARYNMTNHNAMAETRRPLAGLSRSIPAARLSGPGRRLFATGKQPYAIASGGPVSDGLGRSMGTRPSGRVGSVKTMSRA